MRRWVPAALIALLVLLSDSGDLLATDKTTSRCIGIADMPVLRTPALKGRREPTARLKIDFVSTSQCLADESGGRQAVLVALTVHGPAQATVAAIADGEKGLLPLTVALLDARRQPLSTHRFDAFVQRGMRHSLGLHLPDDDSARYLLIAPDLDRIGSGARLTSGARWTTVWATPTVFGSYSDGTERSVSIPFVSNGKVEVEVRQLDDGGITR